MPARLTAALVLGLVGVFRGASVSAPGAAPATITPEERRNLLVKLDASQKKLFAAIQGVSTTQWHWKPAPDRWSIGEVADHLDLAEVRTLEFVQGLMAGIPAAPEKKAETAGKDQRIAAEIPDRTQHRMMRPDFLAPTDRWAGPVAFEKEFLGNRARTIAYVKATRDDVRAHTAPHPEMGLMDGYQWLILIAAHGERHTAQILEIQAMPGYPKE